MRQLKIDLSELEFAFENHDILISHYLDLETGDVLFVSDDERSWLEGIYEEYFDEKAQALDWEAVIQEERMHDWQKERLKEIDLVESGYGSRFIKIPPEDSHEGYDDMLEFILTVQNPRLQERLEDAISGSGVFRRFKDVLLNYPAERERWFQFKQERIGQRMLEWLEEKGITLIENE